MSEHAWEKSSKRERTRRQRERPILNRISRATRFRFKLRKNRKKLLLDVFGSGSRVIDVGCGRGKLLPKPIIPFGIEISPVLAETADDAMRERGGHCVHAPAIEGLGTLEAKTFDGVLLNSFLEHEIKPLPLLKEVFRVLRPNGTVYIRVPNFGSLNRKLLGARWCGFRYPDHVNYFTPASLKALCHRAGFRMHLVNRLNIHLDDNIKAVLNPL